MAQLYLPGTGMVDTEQFKADKAAKEYNELLSFKRNPDTNQWCVYIQMERGFEISEMPVLGFDSIPDPEEMKRRLFNADTVRHGHAMRTAMNKRNADRLKASDSQLDDLAGDAADRMDHEVRKAGEHPFHKSFRKIPKGE